MLCQNESVSVGSTKYFKRSAKCEIKEVSRRLREQSGDSLVGAGLVEPSCSRSVDMGTAPTVFQVEVYATAACAREYVKKAMREKKIHIAADSKSVVRELSSFK